MDRGITQVDKTLQLIRNGFSTKTKEETQLLNDLRRELVLYCRNLEEGNANCEVADTITKSLSMFSKNKSESSSHNTTTNTAQNNQDSNNGITSSIINGTLVYFLDGKQIKFKVFKNKPKNGDFEVRWNRNLEELKQYKDKYGTTRVTRSTSGYKELGNWVAEQRRKLKKGKITQKQFELLNDLAFEWDRSSYFYNTYKQKGAVDKEDDEEEEDE